MFMFAIVSGAVAGDFTLTSPQLINGGTMGQEQLANVFGCSGGNVSPELNWKGAPKGTKSFAVTVFDPDAPTGSGWWHWLIYNIAAETHTLPKNAGNPNSGIAPDSSVQTRTDFGKPGYGGACPPPGAEPHRYQFVVWALSSEKLELGHDPSSAKVGFYLNKFMLDKAELTVKYGR